MTQQWIDSWRGLLISSIVLFHVVGAASFYSPESVKPFFAGLVDVLQSFHTPAFFCLATVTWKTRDGSAWKWIFGKVKRLLVPYWVFGVLSMALYLTMGAVIVKSAVGTGAEGAYATYGFSEWWHPIAALAHGGEWPNGVGLKCNQVLWFLPCMFATVVFYYFLDRTIRNKWFALTLVFPLMVVYVGLLNTGFYVLPFSIQRVPRLLGLMILARCAISIVPVVDPTNRKTCLLWLVGALAAFALVYVFFDVPPCFGKYTGWKYWTVFPAMLCLHSVRTFLLIACTAIIAQTITCNWLAKIGVASLGIMLMHKFVILAFQVKSSVAMMIFGNAWFACVGVVAVTALAIFLTMFATACIRKYAPWAIGFRG